MEINESKKHMIIFLGALAGGGIVIGTLVFPFWNLIREDVYEDTVIVGSAEGTCYAESADMVPKEIEGCDLEVGTEVRIKYGRDLAWAEIVEVR